VSPAGAARYLVRAEEDVGGGAFMTRYFVEAVPVTPSFTGVMDTRQVPAALMRIVQVAIRLFVFSCVATVHEPRAALAARASTRVPDRRVALTRYVVPASAVKFAVTGRVVRRHFDHRTAVGVAGVAVGVVGVAAEAPVGVAAGDAADGADVPYAFDAVAVNVYAVPFARPVTVHAPPWALVTVHVAPPGLACTV